jgi:hypothetical protein
LLAPASTDGDRSGRSTNSTAKNPSRNHRMSPPYNRSSAGGSAPAWGS